MDTLGGTSNDHNSRKKLIEAVVREFAWGKITEYGLILTACHGLTNL